MTKPGGKYKILKVFANIQPKFTVKMGKNPIFDMTAQNNHFGLGFLKFGLNFQIFRIFSDFGLKSDLFRSDFIDVGLKSGLFKNKLI